MRTLEETTTTDEIQLADLIIELMSLNGDRNLLNTKYPEDFNRFEKNLERILVNLYAQAPHIAKYPEKDYCFDVQLLRISVLMYQKGPELFFGKQNMKKMMSREEADFFY